MRYLLSFIFPPLAILLCGKPFTALIALPLTFLYFPAVLLSLLVVASHKADVRAAKMAAAYRESGKEQVKAIDRQTKAIDRQTKVSLAATAAQTKVLAEAIKSREPQPRGELPAPGLGKPVPTGDASYPPAPPRRLRWSDVTGSILAAKSRAIEAYRMLPEWAQPIVWGCAAATPLSIILAALFLAR